MRMQQIAQVLTIAEEGSINKAAQKLYLSQPTLSASLKQLEAELGSQLFERTGKGAVLTPFGSEFLAFAQPAYRQFKLLGEFCATLHDPAQQHFSVASQYLRFANSLFIGICNEFKTTPYEFSFLEGAMQEVADMVRRQEAEIGLIVVPLEHRQLILYSLHKSDLTYKPLITEDIAIIIRKGHPLCDGNGEVVTIDQLKEFPLVMYRDTNYSFGSIWNRLGLEPVTRKILVKDRASLHEIIAGTDAYTLASHNVHAYEHTPYYSNICTMRLRDRNVKLEIGCITSRNRPLSHIASRYLELLEEAMQTRRPEN